MHNKSWLYGMDIVIPVKQDETNEELRYMLRAIDRNVPHRNVVIVGYKPRWLTNVKHIENKQLRNKFATVISHLHKAASSDQVSDTFMLFNDDMFVEYPITNLHLSHKGHLYDSIARLDGQVSHSRQEYVETMKRTLALCKLLNIEDPLDYSLHLPRILNKRCLLEVHNLYREVYSTDQSILFNTLYHNYWNRDEPGEIADDVKIYDDESLPPMDQRFISTSDTSFNYGEVGKYLRERFSTKSKYEL